MIFNCGVIFQPPRSVTSFMNCPYCNIVIGGTMIGHVLCISTSEWVLHTPFAGWNNLFLHETSFFEPGTYLNLRLRLRPLGQHGRFLLWLLSYDFMIAVYPQIYSWLCKVIDSWINSSWLAFKRLNNLIARHKELIQQHNLL